ncbi:branched chain amino acid ABC transporter substrate-binding protein [Deltaproteobacteria bacterium Smac51]|nr:branched chain amino acid ABC transporter substrate-binding protein [Deltaproteobacteria bacterium Smac51]
MRKFAVLVMAMVMAMGSTLLWAQDDKETIKIGFGGALLGNLASYGLSGFYGVEYAVLKTNAEGGLLGKQIEIVREDDGCDPALASSAATKLMGSGLTVVVGHTCSGATRSALSVYGDNVLAISPSATEVSLTEDGKSPYFFRTTPRDDAQSSLWIKLLKNKDFKKVAVLHDKGDYGKALADLAKAEIDADKDSGIEIVLFEGVTSGQVSYDSIISKVKNSGADAVLWGGYYNDASKLAIQMRNKKVDTVIIGADGLYDDRYVKMAGEAAEGSYATGQVDLSQNPMAVAAVEDHKKRHAEDTGTYFLYSAGATQALLAAIEKTGNTTDLATIKKHLQEDTVETAMGPIRFDEKGDVIGAGFKMYEIKGGKFVEVEM